MSKKPETISGVTPNFVVRSRVKSSRSYEVVAVASTGEEVFGHAFIVARTLRERDACTRREQARTERRK
jgi:hypothetical protein